MAIAEVNYAVLYTTDDLAVMWCRLNAGIHPRVAGWRFDVANIPGAMALIVSLVGPSKCLAVWRSGKWKDAPYYMDRRRTSRKAGV